MINEIAFFTPLKITVLCLIGRLFDHRREFLSFISSIENKNEEFKIVVYFGTHWHIPTYFMDENPNTRERNWLNKLIGIQNTPRRISKIAVSIYETLEPRDKKNFRDHRFLPRYKSNGLIPKKELIRVRNEIGKVIGFRFYKESFAYFDNFIKQYESQKDLLDRYREVELLCAAISYEPYIFERVRLILPDIVDKLKEFVETIIFGNSKRDFRQLNISELTYRWDKRDFIHLFFTVFPEDEFISKLRENGNYSKLLMFINDSKISADYVLYKILHFFPLDEKYLSKSNVNTIKPMLKTLVQKGNIKEDSKRQIKIFLSFISTLPTNEDFNTQFEKIAIHYENQRSKELHDAKTTFNHNISFLISELRMIRFDLSNNEPMNDQNLVNSQNYWGKINIFLNPILRFSIKYSNFFMPYPYDELYNRTNSDLRRIIAAIDSILYPINNKSLTINRLLYVEKYIVKVQKDFEIGSDIYSLFSENSTNLKYLIDSLVKELKESHPNVICTQCVIPSDVTVGIPMLYSEKLIIKELPQNVKNYSDKSYSLNVNIEMDSSSKLKVEIINSASKELNYGSGVGLDCLKKLSDARYFEFEYKINDSIKVNRMEIKQVLTFKYKNGY